MLVKKKSQIIQKYIDKPFLVGTSFSQVVIIVRSLVGDFPVIFFVCLPIFMYIYILIVCIAAQTRFKSKYLKLSHLKSNHSLKTVTLNFCFLVISYCSILLFLVDFIICTNIFFSFPFLGNNYGATGKTSFSLNLSEGSPFSGAFCTLG